MTVNLRKMSFIDKNGPIIDYKNVSLLKKYMSDNGKIISSKITSVSYNKQKKLTREIKSKNFRTNIDGNNFIRKYFKSWKYW